MSLKGPEASLDCVERGHEYDLDSSSSRREDCEQVMDGVASGLTLVAAGINISKTTKRCCDDYRGAQKQMLRAQQQGQQFQLNQGLIDELPQFKKERIGPAQASLKDVQASLPTEIHLERKRDHLKWALGRKSKIEREITQYNQIENSLSLNLLVSHSQDIEKLKLNLTARQEELEHSLQLCRNVVYTYNLASRHLVRERMVARVHHWTWLANSLGIKSGIITKAKDRRTLIFARWPLELPFGLSQVLTAHLLIQNFLPSLPKLVLRPQTIISHESEIIKACSDCDMPKVHELLKQKKCHPNDRTPDDLTVFRFGVRSGNPELVRLLLEHGADPNLPFGDFETSPLNNAFFIGNVAIIRLLLNAGAELEYQNSRTWTSLSYLWDPIRPAHTATDEILDICMAQGFSAWTDTDTRGWNPLHRAAAYGCGKEIRNLDCKGANLRSYTTDHLWGPMTCAVWNSNESTFDAFMGLFQAEEIVNIKDSRGWTLLHFAAQKGCEHILRSLLRIGADRRALTAGTKDWVTEGLEWKNLTAETIAREYGHGGIWDKVTG